MLTGYVLESIASIYVPKKSVWRILKNEKITAFTLYLREARVYLREHEQKNKKISSTYLHMSESGRRIFCNLRSNIKYT
jgi:hypothetical protein